VTEPDGETIESQTIQRLALHDALPRPDERELVALRYGADLSVPGSDASWE
jgi:hypothetical protein